MKRKGFTLVEIMIVVAIIALLAAIAIPNLLRARISAQEAAAAAAEHTIVAAQTQFRASNATFGTLANLANAVPPYIDATLGGGTKQGYNFTIPTNTAARFIACAVAITGTQGRSFYVDEAGVICRSTVNGSVCPAHMAGLCTGDYVIME